MLSFNFRRWLSSWTRRPRRNPVTNRPRTRLALEELESRLAPAFVWQGGSGVNWSNNANWVGGVAPTVAGGPVELVFNAGANLTANDDINGLVVNQITISGNYT